MARQFLAYCGLFMGLRILATFVALLLFTIGAVLLANVLVLILMPHFTTLAWRIISESLKVG